MESKRLASAIIAAALLAACGGDDSAEQPGPALALAQISPTTADLKIVGPAALRALQARLVWDPRRVKVTGIAAGPDAARIDRVFHGDLAKAAGAVTLGMTDTRRVLLPARGALFRITFQPVGGAAKATFKIEAPLGAAGGGEAVSVSGTPLEVKLK